MQKSFGRIKQSSAMLETKQNSDRITLAAVISFGFIVP
jgi:hypothetical protein